MSVTERLGLALLRALPAETAHGLALSALRWGLVPRPAPWADPRLATDLAGLALPHPLGLAAGFDKNAVALTALSRMGFSFLETGATTPRAQTGNPRPRLFRLRQDRAVINRFGFNNQGMAAMALRLAARPPKGPPIGLNIGANKDSADRLSDYIAVLQTAGPYADFVTLNVSSPNTEKLRDLQGGPALERLLSEVMAAREALAHRPPVFLKLAPDLDGEALAALAEAALRYRLSGLIATNTTLDRGGLKSPAATQAGGLSGAPLFERATRTLAQLYRLTEGRLPLIGVGGIHSPETALAKIRAGASALQLYTALTWQGFGLIPEILRGLSAALDAEKVASLTALRGRDASLWL